MPVSAAELAGDSGAGGQHFLAWRQSPLAGIAVVYPSDDVLALEPEALEKADSEGLDATLHWLQTLARNRLYKGQMAATSANSPCGRVKGQK